MKVLLPLVLTLPLLGCANTFACKGFPKFAACRSATQAYKATQTGAPPEYSEDAAGDTSIPTASPSAISTAMIGHRPERSPPQTLRIWQAPYEDAQGDLVGANTVLSEIEPRRWKMAQTENPIPRRLRPLHVGIGHQTAPPVTHEDRGGFPLFPTKNGPRRLEVEEVDYREP